MEDLESGSLLEPDGKPAQAKPELGNLSFQRSEVKPLLNMGEPAYVNKREQFHHRTIAFLKAEGRTNIEIAEALHMSPVTINYLVKQPHISQQILELIHRQGDKTLETLHNASLEAAEKLIEIMQEAENVETKRKACNDILDRRYGKPNQPIALKNLSPDQMSDEELAKFLHN